MPLIVTTSVSETEKVAAEFAKTLKSGDVIALYGDLGAGKTAFVRGLAKGLGIKHSVSSPTFALVHEYEGNPSLVHFDMYRIKSWDDLDSTGFDDYLQTNSIIAVEWSQNIQGALPEKSITINIDHIDQNSRKITITKGAKN